MTLDGLVAKYLGSVIGVRNVGWSANGKRRQAARVHKPGGVRGRRSLRENLRMWLGEGKMGVHRRGVTGDFAQLFGVATV